MLLQIAAQKEETIEDETPEDFEKIREEILGVVLEGRKKIEAGRIC